MSPERSLPRNENPSPSAPARRRPPPTPPVGPAPAHLAPRREVALAFGAAFAVALLVGLLQSPEPFFYDSGGYWQLGETFTSHGHFSLLNFNSPVRGYLLPLIYHLWRALADALQWTYSSSAKVFNALMSALIGAVLAPRLAEIAWPHRRWGVGRRLLLVALVLVFWAGFLNYPLSDFPAFALALLALICVSKPESPGSMLLAGLACAAAIDIRPAYVLLPPLVAVLVVWAWIARRGKPHASTSMRSLCAALFLVGLIVVSLPQSLSTHRHFGSWSFLPGGPVHLTSEQLTRGMFLQRYDTYVGPGHGPEMLYGDNSGLALLRKQKGEAVNDTGQYVELLFTHPIVMGGLALSHLVNGLDQRYNTPYIKQLDTGSHRWLRAAGFAIVFLALMRALWPAARRRLAPTRWRYPLALALCGLISLPSAIETRYLLPLYLLSYLVVLLPGWPNPIRAGASGLARYRTVALVLLAGAAYTAIVVAVTSDASSHLTFAGQAVP